MDLSCPAARTWEAGVPFLFVGLAFGGATSAFAVVKRHYPLVIGLGGSVLILMGVLIWTGQFTNLNFTASQRLRARPGGHRDQRDPRRSRTHVTGGD
jgi:hypothetical protein